MHDDQIWTPSLGLNIPSLVRIRPALGLQILTTSIGRACVSTATSLNSSKYALSLLSEDLEQYLNKLALAHGNSLPDLASIEDWVEDISKWEVRQLFPPYR